MRATASLEISTSPSAQIRWHSLSTPTTTLPTANGCMQDASQKCPSTQGMPALKAVMPLGGAAFFPSDQPLPQGLSLNCDSGWRFTNCLCEEVKKDRFVQANTREADCDKIHLYAAIYDKLK